MAGGAAPADESGALFRDCADAGACGGIGAEAGDGDRNPGSPGGLRERANGGDVLDRGLIQRDRAKTNYHCVGHFLENSQITFPRSL